MQKNAFSYVLGVAALSLLCSCGLGKKDEVKVDATEQKAETKEVALADQQAPAEQVAATTENTAAAATTVAQNDQKPDTQTPPGTEEAKKASEENKVA